MAETNIITGQFVCINQTPASVGDRTIARLADYAIIAVYSIGIGKIISLLNLGNTNAEVLFVIAVYLPAVFYTFLWETFNKGQTPGKRIRKIKVVNKDGTTPTIGSFFMRWLLFGLDIFCGIGLLVILISKNHQRIGDLAADTMVIKLDNYHDMQVSLDEFSFLSDNYTPVYEQAAELSLNQVEIIRRTLASDYGPERAKRIDTLYNKVHSLLDIPFDNTPKEKFLYTLIRDYQHFALEEI